jgi:hypothetical protein
LQFLHEKQFYFPAGELTESRFFINLFDTKLYLDPGFLQIKNTDNYIQYPPEYDKTNLYSPKFDIFSFGLILLRMATGLVRLFYIQ